MRLEIEKLMGVDAQTRSRALDTGQLQIVVDGVRVGLVCNEQGAAVFIHEDVADEMKPMLEARIREKLQHLHIRGVRFLPPKPNFSRAIASDF